MLTPKILYLYFHKSYGNQTWQGGNLQWETWWSTSIIYKTVFLIIFLEPLLKTHTYVCYKKLKKKKKKRSTCDEM